MANELQQFEAEMRKAIKAIEGQATKTIRKAAISTFSAIIEDTPIGMPDTWAWLPEPGYIPGTLKANWQANIGSAPSVFLNVQDPNGGSTISGMAQVVNRFKPGDSLYFVNNTPYVTDIEFGYSSQAPEGMFRKNITRFSSFIEQESRGSD